MESKDYLYPINRLPSRTKGGGITLVLGAGISMPRGIPSWDTLAQKVWNEVFDSKSSPWSDLSPNHSPKHVSQFLPIVFELAYRKMGELSFIEILKKYLYYNAKYPTNEKKFKNSDESLAVIARLILQEYKRKSLARVDSIITFNADDFIEQAVQTLNGAEGNKKYNFKTDPIRMFARSTHSSIGGPLMRPIPVFHIHGFLPSNNEKKYTNVYDHMIVFTDTQYWATSANLSFANRIMSSALSEGRCLFIGLSMTDINLLRWLALRSFERDRDFFETTKPHVKRTSIPNQKRILDTLFRKHFWIRPASDDPTGFLSEFLSLRGIDSVEIAGWKGKSFRKLMEECFP